MLRTRKTTKMTMKDNLSQAIAIINQVINAVIPLSHLSLGAFKRRRADAGSDRREDTYEDEDPFSPDIDIILADKQVEVVSSNPCKIHALLKILSIILILLLVVP